MCPDPSCLSVLKFATTIATLCAIISLIAVVSIDVGIRVRVRGCVVGIGVGPERSPTLRLGGMTLFQVLRFETICKQLKLLLVVCHKYSVLLLWYDS